MHDFAEFAGSAYQISDDILGVFGSAQESGKNPMDDIKEGKRTLLTVYALEHSPDSNFLLHMLGNNDITPAEFEKCKTLIIDCGALDYAKQRLAESIQKATRALDELQKQWPKADLSFLHGLIQYLQERKS